MDMTDGGSMTGGHGNAKPGSILGVLRTVRTLMRRLSENLTTGALVKRELRRVRPSTKGLIVSSATPDPVTSPADEKEATASQAENDDQESHNGHGNYDAQVDARLGRGGRCEGQTRWEKNIGENPRWLNAKDIANGRLEVTVIPNRFKD